MMGDGGSFPALRPRRDVESFTKQTVKQSLADRPGVRPRLSFKSLLVKMKRGERGRETSRRVCQRSSNDEIQSLEESPDIVITVHLLIRLRLGKTEEEIGRKEEGKKSSYHLEFPFCHHRHDIAPYVTTNAIFILRRYRLLLMPSPS